MRTVVASENISDEPRLVGEWAKSYAEKEDVVKIKFEKKGNVWKLTVYFRK